VGQRARIVAAPNAAILAMGKDEVATTTPTGFPRRQDIAQPLEEIAQ